MQVMLGGNYVWMLNSHAGYYKRATAIGVNMVRMLCVSLTVLSSVASYWSIKQASSRLGNPLH
jgi:hypothetical protein